MSTKNQTMSQYVEASTPASTDTVSTKNETMADYAALAFAAQSAAEVEA